MTSHSPIARGRPEPLARQRSIQCRDGRVDEFDDGQRGQIDPLGACHFQQPVQRSLEAGHGQHRRRTRGWTPRRVFPAAGVNASADRIGMIGIGPDRRQARS